jgi:hypothetical protein
MDDTEVQVLRLIAREALSSSSRLDRLIERFRRGHIALMLETVAAGILDGSLDARLHPALIGMATLVVGAVPTMIRRVAADKLGWVALPEQPEFERQLLKILLHGVSAEAVGTHPVTEK